MSALPSQPNLQYAQQPPPTGVAHNRSAAAARLANRVRQSNTLQSSGVKLSTENKSNTATNNAFGDILNKVDLSFLSEEERNKVLGVVQRDLAVRAVEKERLKRCRSSILRRDRELAAKNQNALAESTNCLLCGQKFVLLFQPRRVCANCSRPVCRRCSEPLGGNNEALCKLCIKETGYRAMKCNWFYDTVINKFREFGSTAVAKNIFGDKYKHIQNMAEEELATVLSRHGSTASDAREFVVNEQKVAPQSMEQAKDAQISQLRKKLQILMQNTAKEYHQLENDTNLSEHQKTWQSARVGVEFRKEAAMQMRSFCKTLYLTTERHRTMQGASSRNITKQVMSTLRDEVSQIVGHPIEEEDDKFSITSDDDLESVAFVEREGAEERLAQVLLNKVIEDKENLVFNGTISRADMQTNGLVSNNAPIDNYTAAPTVQERIVVVEGSPTRMEMKIDFDEKCEFSWLRENAQGKRVPVKFDFHAEHVITGSTDPTGRENFVLSNSGYYSEEARLNMVKTNEELLAKGDKGVVIQHQLIIWAAKLDDAGRYFAVARIPTGNGLAAMQETEFRLEVERAPRWPIHPLQPPEFLHPLSLLSSPRGPKDECIELSCTVASNPTPRCLFYKNNSPVPVVIMPLLNNEHEMSEISLSSFSKKYTVISCPYQQKVASVSVGYLRQLILRISNPTNEDVATYTCRAWNNNGRTETSTRVSPGDVPVNRGHYVDSNSLNARVQQTQLSVLNSAKNVEDTAITHGDILNTNRNFTSKPPPSPGRIMITRENSDKVRSLSTSTPLSNEFRYSENRPHHGSDTSSISNFQYPPYSRTNSHDEPYMSTKPTVRSPPVNTVIVSPAKDVLKNNSDHRPTQDTPLSPTSDVGSEISSITGSPFQRTSIRRSSGPKVVIDRRSQRRRNRSSMGSTSDSQRTTKL